MAQDVNLAVRIATVLDAAGLNKADKSVKGFDKTVKKLGKTLGVTLSAAAIVNFGKKAAQAFIQDQKEAARLTQVVKNLGLELSAPAINQYIEGLSKASGVTDSQLRPAFQALLTTTGSVTASQKALQQAIDVSVGSGVELTTVAQDLANAYVGNTKGLKKYNLGLTQAQLKAASFTDISKKLNEQFAGANAAYLDTYAGKLQKLSTAASEAQEQIGGAVIDLAMAVTGASDVEQLIRQIGAATDFAVARIDNFIEGFKILKVLAAGGFLTKDIGAELQKIQVEEFNRRLKRDYMKVWNNTNLPMSPQALAQQKASEAAARKRAQEIAKVTTKNTAELKKQNALKKAGTVFDLEQIQLIAALKGKLSDEDRKRIEAQLALLNNNDALATKLTREILMAQDATGNLYRYFLTIGDTKVKNPFEYLDKWLEDFQAKLNALKFPTAPTVSAAVAPTSGVIVGFTPTPMNPIPTAGPIQGPQIPSTNASAYSGTIPTGNFTYGQGNPLNTNVYVTVQGSVTTEEDLTDKIAASLQGKSLSDGQVTYLNRRTGFFE
jgi:hypothetical protein